MQMGYDFEDPRHGAGLPRQIPGFGGGSGLFGGGSAWRDSDSDEVRSPDWFSLRARFQALHALRRTYEQRGEPVLACGSFAEQAQAVLSTCRSGLPGVNPLYSANGKAGEGIILPVAASPTSGARGIQ